MQLHIKERILLPSLFPEKGNFMDFNLKKSIMKKISITEQDKEFYQIVELTNEGRIEWDIEKDKETPLLVDFTEEEKKYIQRSCESAADLELPDEVWAVVESLYNQ